MYHLGQMTIATGVSQSIATTAVPFTIPQGLKSIIVLASGADCYAECKPASSLTTTAALGYPIGTVGFEIPVNSSSDSNMLAVFNNNASTRTVDVWGVLAHA